MSQSSRPVTQYIIQLIQRQLGEHRVVVWFDPDEHYQDIVKPENFPGVTLYAYDPHTGFMALRRELEQIWQLNEPPPLIIYAPVSEDDSQHGLIEYSTAGAMLQPGQQPVERNTRLSIIAQKALNNVLPGAYLSKVIADVKSGQITLAELDTIAAKFKGIQVGVLGMIFESENIEDICLQFLASDSLDVKIQERNAVSNLKSLLETAFEVKFTQKDTLSEVRESLAKHLLIVEFSYYLGDSIPASLATFKVPQSENTIESILRVVKEWRLRNDYKASYIEAAETIEPTLSLQQCKWQPESLQKVVTFAGLEAIYQSLVEKAMLTKATPLLVDSAKKRQSSFWPRQYPTLALRWQMIARAGQVLVEASHIQSSLANDWTAPQLVNHFAGDSIQSTSESPPWCILDTFFRKMEGDEHRFDFEADQHDSLKKLLAKARSRYVEVVHQLTEQFTTAYEQADFRLPEVIHQTNIFRDFVQTSANEEKTAFILVDAFRYEMGLEFSEMGGDEWKVQILPAMATLPTITEVGMAALLPGAERGILITGVGPSKLGISLQGSLIKNRSDRVKHFTNTQPQSLVLNLNQIVPLKDRRVLQDLNNAKLVMITVSDEIDGMWETQPDIARRMHDSVFIQLRRAIKNLVNSGYTKIIITSDHGYLAGEDLMIGLPMDPPGGETFDLHRRVWVGRGGNDIPACIRKPLSAFGIGGDLELVTPRGLGCFKTAGGSTQYFHGGMSLQEIIIPVITIIPKLLKPTFVSETEYNWDLKAGSKQITTRFFTVTVGGSSTQLIATPPRIRLELKSGDQAYSTIMAATYGFDETANDISMKLEQGSTLLVPNTITLLIEELPADISSLDLYLINSETGLVLSKITDIKVAIVF